MDEYEIVNEEEIIDNLKGVYFIKIFTTLLKSEDIVPIVKVPYKEKNQDEIRDLYNVFIEVNGITLILRLYKTHDNIYYIGINKTLIPLQPNSFIFLKKE